MWVEHETFSIFIDKSMRPLLQFWNVFCCCHGEGVSVTYPNLG